MVSLSPRAGIDLIKASKAYALMLGNDFVSPKEVQYLIPFVWGPRLVSPLESSLAQETHLTGHLVRSVQVPLSEEDLLET